jgi:DNA-binding CsgD family transcriptional regulator
MSATSHGRRTSGVFLYLQRSPAVRGRIAGRAEEVAGIERFVAAIRDGAGALVLEGEPGIGKTALVAAAARAARSRGLRVLACTGGSARPWAALAELLAELDGPQLEALPAPQRDALVPVLRGDAASGGDWRAIATATRSLLAGCAPVLVVVDDAHALDRASAQVLAFCARRTGAGLGLLVARRPEPRPAPARAWAAPAGAGPGALNRTPTQPAGAGAFAADRLASLDHAALAAGPLTVLRVGPLAPAALRRLLRERAARPLGRGPLARVEAAAAGNPRLALALAAGVAGESPSSPVPVPPADLRALAEAQLAGLGVAAEEALLAVASLAEPTVEAVARALGPRTSQMLDAAEDRGILERAGRRLRFAHPLLAGAVYARAPLARRRAVHGRLAETVADPEERARQLAHARALPEAIPALRAAAAGAGARGAALAAAELLELALDLGAPGTLRVRAAEQHLAAGDPARARELLEVALGALAPGRLRARALLSLAEIRCHDSDGCEVALELLEQARAQAGADARLALAVDLRRAAALTALGRAEQAADAAATALGRAERLAATPDAGARAEPVTGGDRGLHAQALAARANADAARGRALDEHQLARAIELEDPAARCAFDLRPSLTVALALLWSGRAEEARVLAAALRARHTERGEDAELGWAWLALAWIDCLRGELDAATHASEEASERLALAGTPVAHALGLAVRAQIAACRGRSGEARQAGEEAVAALERAGWRTAAWAPRAALGQLALSLADPAAAAELLAAPARDAAAAGQVGPVPWGGPLPLGDAAEALIALGRLDEAEPLVRALERHGRALGRPWPRGAGARARGLLLAAHGRLDAAERELRRAVAAHEALPIPLERGRNLLALGLVERRRRQRLSAHAALAQAQEAFAAAGAPLWAAQARAASAGVGLRVRARPELTGTEERIARMAASGLTNREIATTLHVSPKTVEAQLARAYRKLGVDSRAQLGARMAVGDGRAA